MPKSVLWAFPQDPPVPDKTDSWFEHSFGPKLPDDEVNPDIPHVIRAKKYRIKPNAKQANILNGWFKIYNIIYNRAVKYIKTFGLPSNYTLRDEVKAQFGRRFKHQIKCSKLLSHTASNAIFDAHKAYVSSIALARVTQRPFRVRYRKANSQAAIMIEREAFTERGMAFRALGHMDLGILPTEITHDCRLKKERTRYYLYVPVDKPVRVNTKLTACGIDPGLRTFQTIYEPRGRVFEAGTNYKEKILPILRKIDAAEEHRHTRPQIRKYINRLWFKIKSLTDDMHYKTISWLTNNYRLIYIGNMSTSSIVGKPHLSPINKRLILLQSHRTFRQRLISACEEKKSTCVVVNEAYTSKMCGNCNFIHMGLGANKRYVCPNCAYTADRDGNAARNIFLKGLHGN